MTATIFMDNSGWVVLSWYSTNKTDSHDSYHDKTTHPLLSINIVAVSFIGGVT
jgi:hypothetical protein